MPPDDFMKRLGALAREEDEDAEAELRSPSLTPRDMDALRAAIVADALTQSHAAPRQGAAIVDTKPRARPKKQWIVASSGLSAAAALALLWLGRGDDDGLPRYAMSHRGGVEAQRGDSTDEPVHLRATSRLELRIRPEMDVQEPVSLRLFVAQGNTTRPIEAPFEGVASGAFRAQLVAGDALDPRPGPARLLALVCTPDACERGQRAVLQAEDTQPAGWQILTLDISYTP